MHSRGTVIGMKKKNTSWIWIVVTLVIIAGLVAFLVFEGKKPGKYDSFAECITASGAKFYGAWWCPHCAAEKALFGKSAEKLPYVECQTPQQKQNALCNSVGITEYPTWIFKDGSKLMGVQTFDTLAAKTGCVAPTN
jgi:thiol-disulfide isomerase/thioredoxin